MFVVVSFDFGNNIFTKNWNQQSCNAKAAGALKVRVLGRERKIVMKGRTKHVTYKKELIKLSEAYKIEKRLKIASKRKN